MSLTINSTALSMNMMRSLDQTQSILTTTLRRISSGVRLEAAVDDPGRLHSSVLAEAKVRGVRQSINNLSEGISLTQTLEGGIHQVELALQRLRELSVQGAQETYSVYDRESLQAEVTQLVAQIDEVVEHTSYNNIGLLNGGARGIELYIDRPSYGGVSESMSVDLAKIDTQEMGRRSHYISQRRGVYLDALNGGELSINGVGVRGTTSSDDRLSLSYRAGSAIAKANAINTVSAFTGVTARAAANVVSANRAISDLSLDSQNYFSINGHKISGFDIREFDANGRLTGAINSAINETGVKAQLDANGQLQLIAEDGRNIQIRYSNMRTMLAIGLADTSGDEVNLKGIVEKSTQVPGLRASTPSLTPAGADTSADYFGTITNIQTAYDPNSSIQGFDVGGNFNPGVENIDYVVQFTKAGGLGSAEFRIISEQASETDAAEAAEAGSGADGEDFSFLVESPPYAQVNTGAYFTSATGTKKTTFTGSVVVAGTYNEGPDREYTLTVVSAGSTDGAQNHARVEVTSDVDVDSLGSPIVLAAFTVQNGVAHHIASATHQTGENLTVTFGPTPRGESVSQSLVSGQEYDLVLKQDGDAGINDIRLVGGYSDFTGDVNMTKTIQIVETGYTQGTNRAKLRVLNTVDGVTTVSRATFSITANAPMSIEDGLSVEFPGLAPDFVGISTGDVIAETGGGSGSYEVGQNVTLSSTEANFVGERGDGTYVLDVTKAGIVGTAEYRVLFQPSSGGQQVLSTGNLTSSVAPNVLADGLTFSFQASTPSIGGTTTQSVSVQSGDDYGDSSAAYNSSKFFFSGAYNGSYNDATVQVKVVQEGRVLAVGESNTDDAAILEYKVIGTSGAPTVTAQAIAQVGVYDLGTLLGDADLSGLEFNITTASASTSIVANAGGSVTNNVYTLGAGQLGYDGTVKLSIDPTAMTLTEDANIRISTLSPVIVGDNTNTTPTGSLKVELLNEGGGVIKSTTLSNIVSATTYSVGDGVGISFTNDFTAATITAAGTNNDDGTGGVFASVAIDGAYNDAYGDDNLTLNFVNETEIWFRAQVATSGASYDYEDNDWIGTYSGNFGTQRIRYIMQDNDGVRLINIDTNKALDTSLSVYNGSSTKKYLDFDSLSLGQKQWLFGDSISPDGATNINQALFVENNPAVNSDYGYIFLKKVPTLRIENPNGGTVDFALTKEPSSVGGQLPVTETIDLNNIFGDGKDPGFDLTVTNAMNGFDDQFNLALKTGDVSATNTQIAQLNVRSLQVDDLFKATLTGDVLEVGDQYAVQVDAPHLNAGSTYTITENVDRLEVGDTMKISVNSAFEPTVYTAATSVTITNGLALQFGAGSIFDVGDELRFQASGYRGGFSVFGQYTDPAYPTTLEVEVIQSGSADGGALLRARRLDGGSINDALADDDPANTFVDFTAVATANTLAVGGAGYIGKGVFMQFDPNLGAGESHYLYKGDKFYIDVIGSLSQNFSSQLVLESDENISIEYSDTSVDNKLGRMAYVGDSSLANTPGTLGSLIKATLTVNTGFSVANLDITTQEGAEDALRIVDYAMGKVSAQRTQTGAMQNRITQEIASLSEALFQAENYGSRIRDADLAAEVTLLARAQIQQQAGTELLRQLNQTALSSFQLIESLLVNPYSQPRELGGAYGAQRSSRSF